MGVPGSVLRRVFSSITGTVRFGAFLLCGGTGISTRKVDVRASSFLNGLF